MGRLLAAMVYLQLSLLDLIIPIFRPTHTGRKIGMPNHEGFVFQTSSKFLDTGLYSVNQDKVSFPILALYYLKHRSQNLCISTVMFKSVSQCHGFLSRKTGRVSRQAFHITVNFWGNAEYPQIQVYSRRYCIYPCISGRKSCLLAGEAGTTTTLLFR
jgi:hypothetical protein